MIPDLQIYLEGGDAYERIVADFGQAAADYVQRAASTNDPIQLRNALSDIRTARASQADVSQVSGKYTGSTSTAANLMNQLYNEPLSAPLEQAGKVASATAKAAGDAVKQATTSAASNWGVWIIGAVLIGAAFFYFGGAEVVRAAIKRKEKP